MYHSPENEYFMRPSSCSSSLSMWGMDESSSYIGLVCMQLSLFSATGVTLQRQEGAGSGTRHCGHGGNGSSSKGTLSMARSTETTRCWSSWGSSSPPPGGNMPRAREAALGGGEGTRLPPAHTIATSTSSRRLTQR